MTRARKSVRKRPLAVDLVAAAAMLGIAAWRTFSGHVPDPTGIVIVFAVAMVYGLAVGWYATDDRKRSWLLAVAAAIIIVVFIILVGAHGILAGTQWAWLLTSLAGAVLGTHLPHRPTDRVAGGTGREATSSTGAAAD